MDQKRPTPNTGLWYGVGCWAELTTIYLSSPPVIPKRVLRFHLHKVPSETTETMGIIQPSHHTRDQNHMWPCIPAEIPTTTITHQQWMTTAMVPTLSKALAPPVEHLSNLKVGYSGRKQKHHFACSNVKASHWTWSAFMRYMVKWLVRAGSIHPGRQPFSGAVTLLSLHNNFFYNSIDEILHFTAPCLPQSSLNHRGAGKLVNSGRKAWKNLCNLFRATQHNWPYP